MKLESPIASISVRKSKEFGSVIEITYDYRSNPLSINGNQTKSFDPIPLSKHFDALILPSWESLTCNLFWSPQGGEVKNESS